MNVSFGNSVKSQESMTASTIAEIAEKVRSGSDKLNNVTAQLRAVLSIDRAAYTRLKTRLPYFCGSSFANGIRRQDQFTESHYMILDIDELPTEEMERLRKSFRSAPQVMLAYQSPGGRGIKVVLTFDAPITDLFTYRALYPAIARDFGIRYNCLKYIDVHQFDPTRISFLCHDADVCFNPDALPIDVNAFLAGDQVNSEEGKVAKVLTDKDRVSDEVFKEMAEVLRKKIGKSANNYYVPQTVVELIDRLEPVINETRLSVAERRSIHYGIKLRVRHADGAEGEINVYHGKRGYSIIPSPRGGTSHALNSLLVEYCRDLIDFKPRLTVVR